MSWSWRSRHLLCAVTFCRFSRSWHFCTPALGDAFCTKRYSRLSSLADPGITCGLGNNRDENCCVLIRNLTTNCLKMQQSARRLTPLLETIKARPQHCKYTSFRPRSCRRSTSSITTGSMQPPPRPASFWTTSKVFLLSVFVASTVYSASTGFPFDRSKRATSPSGALVYATQKDLEKA